MKEIKKILRELAHFLYALFTVTSIAYGYDMFFNKTDDIIVNIIGSFICTIGIYLLYKGVLSDLKNILLLISANEEAIKKIEKEFDEESK